MYTLQHEDIVRGFINKTISPEDFSAYQKIIGATDSIVKSLEADGLEKADIAIAVKQQIPSYFFIRDLSGGRLAFKLVVNGKIPEPLEKIEKAKPNGSFQQEIKDTIKKSIFSPAFTKQINDVIAEANVIKKAKGEEPIEPIPMPTHRA